MGNSRRLKRAMRASRSRGRLDGALKMSDGLMDFAEVGRVEDVRGQLSVRWEGFITAIAPHFRRRPGPGGDRFVYLEEISRKVSGSCDCDYSDDRPDLTSRFKTAAEVRAALRGLGFR